MIEGERKREKEKFVYFDVKPITRISQTALYTFHGMPFVISL